MGEIGMTAVIRKVCPSISARWVDKLEGHKASPKASAHQRSIKAEQANLINMGARLQAGVCQRAKSPTLGVDFIMSRRIVFR
jgi:hypothetical protein